MTLQKRKQKVFRHYNVSQCGELVQLDLCFFKGVREFTKKEESLYKKHKFSLVMIDAFSHFIATGFSQSKKRNDVLVPLTKMVEKLFKVFVLEVDGELNFLSKWATENGIHLKIRPKVCQLLYYYS